MTKAKEAKRLFERSVMQYVRLFEKKHDILLEFWVADCIGTVGLFADYYFNFEDVRYDIDNKIEKDKIFQWHEYNLENGSSKLWINYPSWIKGARHLAIKKTKTKK